MSADVMTNAPTGGCERCTRHAALGGLLGVAGWLGAGLAALAVAAVPFDFGESLCGVWGCYPPVPPLAAMHLLWLVAGGAVVWAARRWLPGLVRPLGVLLIVAGVVGLVVAVGGDLPQWLHRVGIEYQHFWSKRVAYRIATLTDVPIVQGLLAGVVCLLIGRRKSRSAACAVAVVWPEGVS